MQLSIGQQVEAVLQDAAQRLNVVYWERLHWVSLTQVWSNTAIGLDWGMAGNKITRAQTIAVSRCGVGEGLIVEVYFGGHHAYTTTIEHMRRYLAEGNFPSVAEYESEQRSEFKPSQPKEST